MKPANTNRSTDLSGITPDNFEGFKEYQHIHTGRSVEAIQINYPFHITNRFGIQNGEKGDYIKFLQPSPVVSKKDVFEHNYQEKVQ